ncbi:hypothetical protein ACQEVF_11795 [Nonomuraea polychroma]|uniref:hypothetical protein n=1 Tax=Nonomuraea polychroma TaxID=46176 RepID=UPI003D94A001
MHAHPAPEQGAGLVGGPWAVDQALAAGATVIYLEDLATLEARGRHGHELTSEAPP